MTWSPEELVKQLRYPATSGPQLPHNKALMRDAADMIEWLRDLAEAENARGGNAREDYAESQAALGACKDHIHRLRAEWASAIENSVMLQKMLGERQTEIDRLRAELATEEAHHLRTTHMWAKVSGQMAHMVEKCGQQIARAQTAEAAIARAWDLCAGQPESSLDVEEFADAILAELDRGAE